MSTNNPVPARLQALLEQTPVTHLLCQRIQQLDLQAGTIVVQYQATEQFLNPARQVQGGMISAMLDDVTAVLVTAMLEPGEFCATLSLNTAFLSSAQTGSLLGKARLERQGKTICNVCGELWQGERLVATATAVCMVRRPVSR